MKVAVSGNGVIHEIAEVRRPGQAFVRKTKCGREVNKGYATIQRKYLDRNATTVCTNCLNR